MQEPNLRSRNRVFKSLHKPLIKLQLSFHHKGELTYGGSEDLERHGGSAPPRGFRSILRTRGNSLGVADATPDIRYRLVDRNVVRRHNWMSRTINSA